LKQKINSRIGFGTASLHHVQGIEPKLNLLNTAFDAGIKYFDTAPLYGHGQAERMLGQFARTHQSQSPLVIATKVGLIPSKLIEEIPTLLYPYIAFRKLTTASHLVSSEFWQPKRNYSASYITKRIELSLKAMKLDYLDIVFLHEPSLLDLQTIEHLDEVIFSLKKRGLIKAFGISSQLTPIQKLTQDWPELVDYIQAEIPSTLLPIDINWITQNADITFGHFRMQLPSEQTKEASTSNRLQQIAERATKINQTGTILFSTTKIPHINSFVTAIESADQASK